MAWLDFHGGINKFAVYTGADDAPLTAPLANLPRVKWHSDLEAIGFPVTLTGTADINPVTNPGGIIVAHGRSYAPLLKGHVVINGFKVPIQGDFLVTFGSQTAAVNIYADVTNVRFVLQSLGFAVGFPNTPFNVSYVIHVANVGRSAAGASVKPPFHSGLTATDTRLQCGYYDTNDKHLTVNPAGDVVTYTGASLDISLGFVPAGGNYVCVGIVQNINGYSVTGARSLGGNPYPGNNLAFTPAVIRTTAK